MFVSAIFLANSTGDILVEKITISVLSCYINLIHPDLEEREKRLHQFETYIRYASMFGAKSFSCNDFCPKH
jgi:hypothetical protein